MAQTIAIAGAGLAGLTAAKSLADAGFAVELFEAAPHLGGRAATFRDADGEWVEQGLHIFLGTYSEFKKLLREIGQDPEKVLWWMDEIRYQDPLGSEAIYGTNPFAAPLKTLLGMLGQNRYLGPLDKVTMLPLAAPSVMSLEMLARQFDDKSVAQWWRSVRGTEDVLEKFLRPFCRAIQFTEAEDFSAYNFLGWLHHVAYDLPHALVGSYRGAREELVFRPLAAYLERRGVRIHTQARLAEILFDPEHREVQRFILRDGSTVEADAFVVALPAWQVPSLLPPAVRHSPFFSGISALPAAPAISVQLWFDRLVVQHSEFVLTARSVVPVYQDQSRLVYPNASGSRISTVIAPADDYLDRGESELVAMTREALQRVVPEIARAQITKSHVLKHRQHLLRPLPGAMTARPPQKTPVPNLFLAGDWTQQEYFGSQEGAVRSGRRCAEEVVRELRAWTPPR